MDIGEGEGGVGWYGDKLWYSKTLLITSFSLLTSIAYGIQVNMSILNRT